MVVSSASSLSPELQLEGRCEEEEMTTCRHDNMRFICKVLCFIVEYMFYV